MSKAKLFIENFLVYGLGGVISNVIPFIMVPIVTRLMPGTEYFGLSDLSGTVISFASALAIIGMYDALFRMFFEKDDEEYKKSVCSTALFFSLVTSLFVFALMLCFRNEIAHLFFGNSEYVYLVYITAMATLVGATNGIISAPTRMQNKRKIFLVANTVSPILSYCISIPLLLKGYYVIALPLAGVVSGITMETAFWFLNWKWFSLRCFDFTLLKQLLKIAVPLFPNFLIYWIFNSSDRLMIANLLDVGQAGIYSVGSKLGHASQLIYTAFAGAGSILLFPR
ncbi:MAG: lipopolysaccharide biosynthesis protein [Treponema sp.]